MEHYSYMDLFQYACGKRGGKYAFCAENEEDFLRLKGTLRQAVSEKLGLHVITGLAGPEDAAGAGRRDALGYAKTHGLRGRAGLCGRRKDRLRRFFRRRTGLHVACGHG